MIIGTIFGRNANHNVAATDRSEVAVIVVAPERPLGETTSVLLVVMLLLSFHGLLVGEKM